MKVGVIGAGTMGAGIAQAFAMREGYNVILCDLSEDLAAKGKENISRKLQKLTAKEKIQKSDADAVLSRIEMGNISMLGGCELVVEAVLENMELKKKLFASLQDICAPDTIFASNTSSLSLTEIAQGLDRTVVGMHFFNPADVMKLVEVIAGVHTSRETVERIMAVASDIGKTPIEVREAGGFVVNRILIPMINEAVGVLADGTASAQDIDVAMKLGANHPMGPLALGDLIGLDVCLAVMETLQSETGDSKYRPHPLLRKMVRGGLLGRKSGKGFFDYN